MKSVLSVGCTILFVAACSSGGSMSTMMPAPDMSTRAPSPDPRVGLRAGWMNAGEAIWNLRKVSHTPPSEHFINMDEPGSSALWNSDISFRGNYAIQGNFSGLQIWDISNPARPRLVTAYVCPGSQSDPSVHGNLLFVSSEATGARLDCGLEGIEDTVSVHRLRGIRIFDITDIRNPRYISNVQTCRGSHTHTLVPDPRDPENIYLYISGSAPIRSPQELPGCSGRPLEEDPNTAEFRIEVVQVPLAAPERARIVNSPRIFQDLAPPPAHVADPEAVPDSTGPTQCHDITVYPQIGLAGGACEGYGLLLDISDVANPRRIDAVADANFSYWHSATINNDGSKIMFTDEWGGGTQPRCRPSDRPEWGANALFTLENRRMRFQSYYKMPAPQTEFENCVAHNGSMIPVPGRDIMVQAWYQGGISLFDWTDPANPVEIAYQDRGPMNGEGFQMGGSWSVYWYNGYMYSSEIARGMDIFELVPSGFLTQNEIDAAKLVRVEYMNAQTQVRPVWPAAFVVSRAYVDQLERSRGLAADRIAAVRAELARAEGLAGAEQRDALNRLASSLDSDARSSGDAAKVRLLAGSVRELAAAAR